MSTFISKVTKDFFKKQQYLLPHHDTRDKIRVYL